MAENNADASTANHSQTVQQIAPSSRRDSQLLHDLTETLHSEICRVLHMSLTESVAATMIGIDGNDSLVTKVQLHHWFPYDMQDVRPTPGDDQNWLHLKEFRLRESIITEFFKINHFRTLRILILCFLVGFVLDVVVQDIQEFGFNMLRNHVQILSWMTAGLEQAFSCWITMKAFTIFIVYASVFIWIHERPNASHITHYDKFFIVLYAIYLVAFTILPAAFVLWVELRPVATLIVILEQIRLLMKSHAFIRAHVEKALMKANLPAYQQTESQEIMCQHCSASRQNHLPVMSNFSSYLYFLFAPTLIFQDVYPRTSRIRWRRAFGFLREFFLGFPFLYFLIYRFAIRTFSGYGSSPTSHWSLGQFVIYQCHCILPGLTILYLWFYGFFQCWLNFFAEVLRFGDRMFYKDFWNSDTSSQIYRRWNVVIHDWLYMYIYRDVFWLCGNKQRLVPALSVFLLSAIVHEYVIIIVLRFFSPILFFMMLFGVFAVCNRPKARKRKSVWEFIIGTLGSGVLMCLYSMEWYARRNCAPVLDCVLDRLIPRMFFC